MNIDSEEFKQRERGVSSCSPWMFFAIAAAYIGLLTLFLLLILSQSPLWKTPPDTSPSAPCSSH